MKKVTGQPTVEPNQPGDSTIVNALMASIVASSDDAILSESLDGIINSWNPAAERMYGYSADEAIGQPFSILIPSDRTYEAAAILVKIRNGERVEHFETIRVRKNGSPFPSR